MDGVAAWAAVCAIVAAAAVAQGLSGFGFSLVSIPLLALVVPVKAAIVGGAVLGLVQSGLVVARDHRHVEWRSAGILIVAAIAGMPIGLFVITRVRPEPLQVAIAAPCWCSPGCCGVGRACRPTRCPPRSGWA